MPVPLEFSLGMQHSYESKSLTSGNPNINPRE